MIKKKFVGKTVQKRKSHLKQVVSNHDALDVVRLPVLHKVWPSHLEMSSKVFSFTAFPYLDNIDIRDADEGGRPDGRHKWPRIWSRVPELHQVGKRASCKLKQRNICYEIKDCDEPQIDHKMVIRGQEGPHGSLQLLKSEILKHGWLEHFHFLQPLPFSPLCGSA